LSLPVQDNSQPALVMESASKAGKSPVKEVGTFKQHRLASYHKAVCLVVGICSCQS
jgi:hypothetical protein